MKTILFFQQKTEGLGSVESWLCVLIPALKTNYICLTFSIYDKRDDNLSSFSFKEIYTGEFSELSKSIKMARNLASFTSFHTVDTVIASGQNMVIISMLAKKLFGMKSKIIATVHQEVAKTDILHRLLLKYSLKQVDQCVAVSRGIRDGIKSLSKEIRVTTIHPPISFAEISLKKNIPLERAEDEEIMQGRVFIAVGRLEYSKAHIRLIEAFSESHEYSQSKLVIVGEGDLRPILEQRIAELQSKNKIFLLGYRENVFPYLSRSVAFFQASLFESFGISIVEAMAIGLPTIVSNCCFGPKEIHLVKDVPSYPYKTEYGYLVKTPSDGIVPFCGEMTLVQAINSFGKDEPTFSKDVISKRARDFDISYIKKEWTDVIG